MRFLLLALAVTGLSAQEFDVVSVKPSAPDEHNSFMFQNLPGGTVRMLGAPLRMVIMQAYDVKAFQISGGPDWIRMERWDIIAKAEGVDGRLARAKENLMLRAMMKDRFQLKVHNETKEMPVYALEVDKNGSKLAASVAGEPQVRSGNGMFSVKKGDMATMTNWLTRQLGRVVIDKTGLKGEFDYKVDWTPEAGEGGPESIGMSPDTRGAPPTETNGPSIFTALREQLGLRLVSQKGPVEVIVIDRVERPAAN